MAGSQSAAVLSEISGPEMPWCGSESVCSLFERQVDLTPEAVAIISEGRSLTYLELEGRVNQLARYLKARFGVGPETTVGLLVGRSERMLISMLGVLKAGGAYVPISPEYPENRVAYILQDSEPTLLITEDRYRALAASFPGNKLLWDDSPLAWAHETTERPAGDNPGPGQLAYVMYTSGSTGWPKGVMAEHRNLSNFLQWCIEEYRNSTYRIVYACTPYGFDLSNIELFFPLTVGSKIRLLPSSQMIGLYLRRDRDVLVNTVPSLAQQILRTTGALDNVTVLNLGGEAVPPSLAKALQSFSGVEVRNMYGPTETTSTAINYRMHGAGSEVLIGKPIANTFVYIVDEQMQLVPIGVKGEICIGGRGLTRGYWRRAELTRERYVKHPFHPGELLYRTGDFGMCLPDGNIRYLGRCDNQVKLRGFRVELDEISNCLAGHPDVSEAVVGVKKTAAGERLAAYVRQAPGGASADTLSAFMRQQLPVYMIPEEILIVDRLPLTPTGKVDRMALFPGNAA